MTTQSGSSSPFQDSLTDQSTSTPEKFSFRTMQDDLLALQKNNVTIITDSKQTETPAKELSSSSAPTDPSTQSVPKKEYPTANKNPFISQAPASSAPAGTTTPFPNSNTPQKTKLVEIPTAKPAASKSNNLTYKILASVIVFLITGIIILGGYYFWMTRTPKQVSESVQPTIETAVPVEEATEPVIITPPIEKYSPAKPNYLTIDLATLSAAEIQAAISAIANDLKDLTPQTAYEFTAVDTNNNPIPFSVFATNAKLNFSQAALSALGENFSIYLYNNNGEIRLGLAINVLKSDTLTAEIQKQEKTLPSDIAFIFLDSVPDTTAGLFKDGSYYDTKTRYMNLNAQGTLSIDYAINNTNFTIGTSKNTERAVLDKIYQENKQPVQQPQQNDTSSPISDESSTTINTSCSSFSDKLASCTPFVCSAPHPLTGEQIKKEIIGVVDGKCGYAEQMPNNGKMKCNYTADMQKKISDAAKEFASTGNASFSSKTTGTSSESNSTVNGNANPMQEALESGQCIISRY